MAYIGKSPTGSGVRTRYYYTATGGETSLSGADDNGKTLTFSDGEYMDVYLNGVLLVHGTDYGTGTANTISSLAALAGGDIAEVIVYDVYNIADVNRKALRTRYYKTAAGGETSISGTDDSGATITFAANAQIEVKLNGVSLVQGTDYNTTTANTVGGLSALAAGQVVEIVKYERFVLGDTVSKADGGTFSKSIGIDADGATVLTVDRATSDGTIIDVQKNGSAVGSVGAFNGNAYYAGTGCGLRPRTGDISPTNASGSTNDGGVDLGTSSNRFQNIWLSGGAYLGGTATANKLDDYEEGTWTPTYVASGGSVTMSTQIGKYTKIGDTVYIFVYVAASSSSLTGTLEITGLPFTSADSGTYGWMNAVNSTWSWNDQPRAVYVSNSSTAIRMWDIGTNQITGADMVSGAGSNIIFSLHYKAS